MVFWMESGNGLVGFYITYLSLAAALFLLERWMPHEKTWLENCGQILPDLLHTILNKGIAVLFVFVGMTIGLVQLAAPAAGAYWPSDWPLLFQVLLGLTIGELALYTAHRLAHEWPLLWRFHAVHHSVTRLWFWNTGRFHVVDTLWSISLNVPLLLAVGAPEEVIVWGNAITAFVGMLTHCNVEMRFGWLSYAFNTPELHRWHHSKKISEGNRNYGENLMIFDLLFRTWYNPKDHHPPADIGINEPMADNFIGQLAQPFRRRKQTILPAE